jgi:ParB family chromosome partitioning protein
LVRATKQQVRPGARPGKSVAVRDLETRLSRKLGTECRVRDNKGRGVIVVRYASLDELDRLLELLL